jgi:hypothetical protein
LNIVILIHTTFYPYDKMADFREMPPYPKAYYPQKEALWWTGHGKFAFCPWKQGFSWTKD